jgi:peptidoglycan/LPS O-acetylase OafA/YrhL
MLRSNIVNENKTNWEILALARFLLAFIVMLGHLSAFCDIGYWSLYSSLGSFEAILGFLLISGLSIGYSLEKDSKNYYARRVKRIYPVFLASLIFQAFVVSDFWSITVLLSFFVNLFFLNQILPGDAFLGVSWTLSTEVWLYFLAPFFKKIKLQKLYLLMCISFLAYCFYTCGRTLFHWKYYSGTSFGLNLIFLSFIWIGGFVLAVFPQSKTKTMKIIGIMFICHLALTILIQSLYRIKHNEIELLFQIDFFSFVSRGICLLFSYSVIAYNDKLPKFSIGVNKIFKVLGDISYPLYLTHCTFFVLMTKYKVNNLYVMIIGELFFSFVIYYVFDFYSKKRRVGERTEVAMSIEKVS